MRTPFMRSRECLHSFQRGPQRTRLIRVTIVISEHFPREYHTAMSDHVFHFIPDVDVKNAYMVARD